MARPRTAQMMIRGTWYGNANVDQYGNANGYDASRRTIRINSAIDRVDDSAVSLEATGQLSGDDVSFLESRPTGRPSGGE